MRRTDSTTDINRPMPLISAFTPMAMRANPGRRRGEAKDFAADMSLVERRRHWLRRERSELTTPEIAADFSDRTGARGFPSDESRPYHRREGHDCASWAVIAILTALGIALLAYAAVNPQLIADTFGAT